MALNTELLKGIDGNAHFYDPNICPQRNLSFWQYAPTQVVYSDPSAGYLLREDWNMYDPTATAGEWVLTQATAGTAAKDTVATGVLLLDAASSTADQGVQIQRTKSAFVPIAGKKIWAEWQIKIVDTYDKALVYVGLSSVDTSIFASGATSNASGVGFAVVGDGAGAVKFVTASTTETVSATVHTLAEDTYVRLGFIYDGVSTVTPYVNGVAGSAVTTTLPSVAIYPSLACLSDGTNDPIMHVRPFQVLQA